MSLMDAQDQLGEAIQAKREENKVKQEAADQAKEEAKQEMQQHEENKKQGMI